MKRGERNSDVNMYNLTNYNRVTSDYETSAKVSRKTDTK